LLSRAPPALVHADDIWISSQPITAFLPGNSTAVERRGEERRVKERRGEEREERRGEERREDGWNSQLRFLSNQKWNKPCFIINPPEPCKVSSVFS
jgi:hypothetical protein